MCSLTDALRPLFFDVGRFQSTLKAEHGMDEQAPRTHGLIIHWAAQYDLLAWLLTHGRERELRERFISLAALREGEAALDIGCGTGTLAIAASRHVGAAGSVTGIDASPSMIARAKRKAAKAAVHAAFEVAVAESLPFPDAAFDVVLSTLMLHHLPRKTRQQCSAEVNRVLKPGGRVLAVDFGGSQRGGFLAHFHRHGHVTIEDIVKLFEEAGVRPIRQGAVGMNDLNFVLAKKSDVDSGRQAGRL